MLLSMQDSAEASYKVGHPIRVFIHGGCVSRDSVEFAEPETYRLIRYIARHSLLSAGSDAAANIPALEIPSNFQRRMAEFDVRGNLIGELRRIRHCDIVLWDLVVERSGVYEFADGSVVTNSAELRKANQHQQFFKSARHIPFGSDEHFARWAGSAAMYSNIVQELGLQDRFLVLAPDWAEKDLNGKDTGRTAGLSAADFNGLYERYYQRLETLGFNVLRIHDTIADPDHKWGSAPFHYEKGLYTQINNAVVSMLSRG